MAISVSKSGEIWNGASWIGNPDGTAIGLLDYSGGVYRQAMTVFTLYLDKAYSSITLNFSMVRSGVLASYSTTRPANLSAGGTQTTLSTSNSITLRGSYSAGQTVTVYVWGRNYATYDYAKVNACSATGVEPTPPTPVDDGGVARVRIGSAWSQYVPRVRVNGAWASYEPYVYYNGGWRKMV